MAENENAALEVSPELAREPLDASGASFIHYAAGLLPEPAFSKALGSTVHPKDQFGLLPIHTAAVSGNAEVVAKLAADSLQREAKTNRGATPLILAIENGHLAVVEKLIECGANANEHLANGLFPLYLAIQNNYPQLAVLLLDKVDKLDVNAHPDSGMTPLHLAIENGLDAVALLLITKNAVLDSRRKADGFTAFHLAAQSGKVDLMRAMLATGLSIHLALESQKTGLHLAAENGHLEAVCYLVEQGASADAKTTDGETPLMLAIQAGYEDVALELTKTAIVNTCNQQQQSVSLLAVQHAMPKVADALIARGEKVEQVDRHGYDYVYYLTRQGDFHRLMALINGKIVSPGKQ
ncbi:ankyrin repeat domain-containing protein [Legionella genomosp. 1]|uniref:ankyrin repeat domain-containing protein n=1 Tax=Legionella genomosp. 1 TaxID=1093625 RepID=UPI0021CAF691|nr:ankyrin repeat domain-containing protein [Legionella genomosp. 1]